MFNLPPPRHISTLPQADMVSRHGPDFSAQGWARVALFTALGTAFCIAVAYAIDGYSKDWQWGPGTSNNFVIPLVLAPPFFFYLLSKLRQLALAHQALTILASIGRTDRVPEPACLHVAGRGLSAALGAVRPECGRRIADPRRRSLQGRERQVRPWLGRRGLEDRRAGDRADRARRRLRGPHRRRGVRHPAARAGCR